MPRENLESQKSCPKKNAMVAEEPFPFGTPGPRQRSRVSCARRENHVATPQIVLQGSSASWNSDRQLTIGRMPSCEVVLDDASVSRRHAEVVYTEAGWVVRDLGSTNGTLLNGSRLGRVAQRLRPGDQLQPGKVVLSVKAIEESTAAGNGFVGERAAPTQDSMPVLGALTDLPPDLASAVGLLEQQRVGYMQALLALAQAVDSRDPCTVGHSQRVTDYVLLLAQAVHVAPSDYHHLQLVTPLHDIGKIAVEDAVLRKTGRLTPVEYNQIKSHCVRGAAILETIPELNPALPIVRNHHEHWDGTGYPDGLIGEAIPHLARMVTVADVFDALTSDRPYRKAMSTAEACTFLAKNTGTLLDPAYTAAFLQLRPRLERMVRDRGSMSGTVCRPEIDRVKKTMPGVSSSLVRPA
jgi:HD-GYP domain-containing protein (c-di-GMP phosphodiesterase class II)